MAQKRAFQTNATNNLPDRVMALIDPFINGNESPDSMSRMVAAACVAWNASLADEEMRPFIVGDFIRAAMIGNLDQKTRMEITASINALIRRKLSMFPKDSRFIKKYSVEDMGNKFSVTITANDLFS